MASLSSVTLELKVAGEQAATQALNRFYDAGEKVGTSVVGLASKVSSVQSEWKKLSDLYNRQVIGLGALSGAQEKLVSQLASLTGMTTAQARNALKLAEADQKAAQAAQQRAQADAKAAAEAQKRMQSIANLEGSILKESRAIGNAVKQMSELSQAQANGTVSANKMQQAELEVARALAATNGYLKSNGQLNVQRAQAEIRAAQAAEKNAKETRDAAAAAQQYNRATEQLRQRFQTGYAEFSRTRQAMRDLREAYRRGIIDIEEYRRQLEQLRTAHQNAANGANEATRRMSRLGVITQQAGYQVGDFFVQIQSGTNIMVAFGQQATQLIGTFAMLARSTRAIAAFSALGVLVSIGSAVAASLMRASGESDTLEQRLQKLDKTADDLLRGIDRLRDTDLDQTFGSLTQEVRELTAGMNDLNKAAALNNLVSTINGIKEAASAGYLKQMEEGFYNIGRFINPFADGEGPFGIKLPEEVEEEAFAKLGLDMSKAQFDKYTSNLLELAKSGDMAAVTKEFAKMFGDAIDGSAEITASGIALLQSTQSAALTMAELAAETDGSAQASRDAAEAEKRRQEYMRNSADAYASHVAAYQAEEAKRDASRIAAINLYYDNAEKREAELALVEAERKRIREGESEFLRTAEAETELARRKLEILQSYNAEGEATARTQELQIQLDMDILRGKLLQQVAADGITQAEREAIDALVDANAEILRTEAGLNNAADSAKSLAGALREANAAMQGLAGFSANLDKALAVSVAKVEALKAGANAAVAGTIAGMRVDLDRRMQAAVDSGVDRSIVESMFGGERRKIGQLEASEQERVRVQEEISESSRSGGAGAREAQKEDEYLYKLEQEAIAKRALIGLSEEQKLQDERRAQITLKLAEDGRALTDLEEKRIEGIIQMEAETRKLMQAEQERQQLMDTIEGHIQNAFMTMVDGSQSVEDAFRSMLRNIILAIYQQQVAKPAAESIGNWLSSAVTSFFGAGSSAPTTSLRPVARPTMTAHGHGLDRGLVNYFANGGVVDSITPFSYSGGTGIMGEAGPEAIMPLKRGKDGKLGVQAEGGGAVVIHQNFNFSANGDDSVKRIIRGEMPRITEATKAAVVDAKRRGGSYGRSF